MGLHPKYVATRAPERGLRGSTSRSNEEPGTSKLHIQFEREELTSSPLPPSPSSPSLASLPMPLREAASQAHLRARMAGSTSRHAFPGVRAPQWTSKAFLGEFGDAFVQATDLEGGQTYQSIPEYCAVVREAMAMPGDALSLLRGSRDDSVVERVLGKLQQAADVAQGLRACRGWETAAFDAYLAERSTQVEDLAVGDFLLWCGGWSGVSGGHAIMYMVDKVSQTRCDFVTFNTGQGVGNHPDYARGYPKQKRYTQMRLRSTTAEIADPAWLWIVFKIQAGGHKDHTPEMFYNVALPALVGDSLVRACADSKSVEDPYAVPETLQRSGVCYYRCILTAARYCLRRLGFKQPQVKQLMHVTRRAFVARVKDDLLRCGQVAAGRSGSDKAGVLAGLYPSQLRLVRLSAELLGYSAIKESKAGRMSAQTLANVVEEVDEIESLASSLPVIGAGETTNAWLSPGGGSGGESKNDDTSGNKDFHEAAAASHSVSAFKNGKLDDLAGDTVGAAARVQIDFGCLPASRREINDYASLKCALTRVQGLCHVIRGDEQQRVNLRLMRVCSLLEYAFLELLPIATWDASGSGSGAVWHAPDLDEFEGMRDTLRWCANEYASASLSMPVPESTAARVLTHTAIAIATYECIRAGPLGDMRCGAGVTAKFLREMRLGLACKTQGAGEDLVEVTSRLVMDLPGLVVARASICDYITQMHEYCRNCGDRNACFSMAHKCEWKLGERSSEVQQTLELVARLREADPGFRKDQEPRRAGNCFVYDCVRGQRQTDNQLTDLQKALAWMIRQPGKYDRMRSFRCLDSWLCLRDAVTGFVFAITAVPPTVLQRGAAKVYPHRFKHASKSWASAA